MSTVQEDDVIGNELLLLFRWWVDLAAFTHRVKEYHSTGKVDHS